MLFSSADRVARGVVRAIDRGAEVAYVPGWWRLVMWVICSIPERLFKKLSL
jgi:short-subunit dehydrogenase